MVIANSSKGRVGVGGFCEQQRTRAISKEQASSHECGNGSSSSKATSASRRRFCALVCTQSNMLAQQAPRCASTKPRCACAALSSHTSGDPSSGLATRTETHRTTRARSLKCAGVIEFPLRPFPPRCLIEWRRTEQRPPSRPPTPTNSA